MLSKEYYVEVSQLIGNALAVAYRRFGEDGRTSVYETVYLPTVKLLTADNDRFDKMQFSFAVGAAETASLVLMGIV